MRPTPIAARAGFTIVELLVALSVLAVGVLALAGTAALLLRAETRAFGDQRAAAILADRVERVAATTCVDGAGGATVRGVTEQWTTWTVDSVHWLADSVRWSAPGDGARSAGVATPVRCAP